VDNSESSLDIKRLLMPTYSFYSCTEKNESDLYVACERERGRRLKRSHRAKPVEKTFIALPICMYRPRSHQYSLLIMVKLSLLVKMAI